MIGFNTLLLAEGIDPKLVKLARHQQHKPGRPTPYQLWQAKDGRFERYQQIQRRNGIFKDAKMLAAFVATPMNETLFVGLYRINGVGKAAAGMRCPVSDEDDGGLDFYDLELAPQLSEYRERLVVEWGEGYRSWVQLAKNQDKPVIEIRSSSDDPPFPGFLDFRIKLNDLPAVPRVWREVLSSVRGVYLLINPKTGKQYVGSADGAKGFWGRWEDYVANGHGGNVEMRKEPNAEYWVTVLEVVSSSADTKEIRKLEKRWKLKLLTLEFGLNKNL